MKKIIAFILICVLSCSLVAQPLSVKAEPISGTLIALEEAFAYFMASFGVGANTSSPDISQGIYNDSAQFNGWYSQQFQKYKEFAMSTYGLSQSVVDAFWYNVRSGTLLQSAKPWQAFKEWIQNNRDSINDSETTLPDGISILQNEIGDVQCYYSESTDNNFDTSLAHYIPYQASEEYVIPYSGGISVKTYPSSKRFYLELYKDGVFLDFVYSTSNSGVYILNRLYANHNKNLQILFTFNDSVGTINFGRWMNILRSWDGFVQNNCSSASDYATVKTGLNDILTNHIGLANKDDYIKGQAIDGQGEVSLNWGAVIDRLDGIENLMDKIKQAIDDVSSFPLADGIAGSIPFDITNDKIIDDSGVTDRTIEQELTRPIDKPIEEENLQDKTVEDFATIGLGLVFPFCIPFDFVAIVKAFNTEPVAPKFVWNVPSKDLTVHENLVEIDLSVFDSVAKVFRVCMLVSFVIGLLFLTRKLIFA